MMATRNTFSPDRLNNLSTADSNLKIIIIKTP